MSAPLHLRIWRAWRGSVGDNLIWIVGIAALLAHVGSGEDMLPIAVAACLLLLGRQIERSEGR